MAAVVIKNIQKNFGASAVIRDVSIDIADGEFVVLVGPSGCGKSTLLRMIAGLENISGGQLLVNGKVLNTIPAKDRNIAMVFQSYALYPHMTVENNIGFSLQLKKTPKDEIARAVAKAAQALDLSNLLKRYPRELSGGQRQRVAMGRAIVRDPQVFLFDEPLSNLDAKLRVQMRGEIKALHQRLGTTTVYVTHDQIEAMMMADKIVVMRDGRVEQIGSPLALYDHPANMFVAGFIGSPAMNFIPDKLAEGMFVSDGGFALPVTFTSKVADGTSLTLGVRPEHTSIAADGILAEVVLVEPTGSETQVLVRLWETQQLVCIFRERIAARPGDVLNLKLNENACHFFDTGSGKCIH